MPKGIARQRSATSSPDFYQFPELYDALKTPAPEDVASLRRLFESLTGLGPWELLDPACGPGNWLSAFADGFNRLVGNDLCGPMVDYGHEKLRDRGGRIVQGDMFALPLGDQRFDIVFEASGVTSIVPDVAMMARWIEHLGGFLRSGGVVVLLFNCQSKRPPSPGPLWSTGWRAISPGRTGCLEYFLESVSEDGSMQRIRRRVQTSGVPDVPPVFEEEYDLRIWTPREIEALEAALTTTRLEGVWPIDVVDPETTAGTASSCLDECYLAFRP